MLEMHLEVVLVHLRALQFGARVGSQDHGRCVAAQQLSLLAHLSGLGTVDDENALDTMSGSFLCDLLGQTSSTEP